MHDLSASRSSACPVPTPRLRSCYRYRQTNRLARHRHLRPRPPCCRGRPRSRARLEDPRAALDLTLRGRMDKGKSVVAELAASFSDVRVAPRQNRKPKSFLPSPSFCKLLFAYVGVTS